MKKYSFVFLFLFYIRIRVECWICGFESFSNFNGAMHSKCVNLFLNIFRQKNYRARCGFNFKQNCISLWFNFFLTCLPLLIVEWAVCFETETTRFDDENEWMDFLTEFFLLVVQQCIVLYFLKGSKRKQ